MLHSCAGDLMQTEQPRESQTQNSTSGKHWTALYLALDINKRQCTTTQQCRTQRWIFLKIRFLKSHFQHDHPLTLDMLMSNVLLVSILALAWYAYKNIHHHWYQIYFYIFIITIQQAKFIAPIICINLI